LFAFEPVTSTKQISLPNTALNATAEMQPSADISQDPGPLAEQPIAVTDSSQYNLPKVSRHAFALLAFEPVTSPNQNSFATIALKAIAEMQPSADSNNLHNASSFNDKPSSTFQLVVASVNWKSKAISNLGYNQHESSCVFHLVAHAKYHNKSNAFAFRLIVGFIQKFQRQMQQDLVNLSLSNAFSIAKLDSIRIKANANLQITTQEAVPHFNVGRFYELIVDSKDPNHSRLIVDLFSNPYWEGVEYIRNVSRNKLRRSIVEYIFIVEFSQQHQSTFQQDLANAWTFITTISIANLETSKNFQRRVMPNRIHQLIVKLTPNTDSVGVLAQENILNARRVSLFQRFVSFTIYKPIGAAPQGHFFVGGGGGVWAKKFVTLRGLRISEKKEILRKPTLDIVS
jgi:hypothetical protein